jgi:excinuclease UvrABC helicase subunit UvrB
MFQNQDKNHSFNSLFKLISECEKGAEIVGLTGSEKAYILFRIYEKSRLPMLVIARSVKEAER